MDTELIPKQSNSFLSKLWGSLQRSVLFSSHNLDVVKKVCDKIAFIRGGELACVLEKKDIAGDFDIDAYFMSLNGV